MRNILSNIVRTFRGEISTPTLIKRGLKVGENFNRMGGCIIDPPHCFLIEIGHNVTLASRVYILAHDASTKIFLDYTKIGKVVIGDNVFVGAYSIILPNVKVGNNVIIAAGSVVTKDIPSNSVVGGNPAKIISNTDDFLKKNHYKINNSSKFNESYRIPTNEQIMELREATTNKIAFIK